MPEDAKPKRKTTTSTAVKRRYNEKHYKRFQTDIKIELSDKITAYIEREGLSKPEFLQKAFDILENNRTC